MLSPRKVISMLKEYWERVNFTYLTEGIFEIQNILLDKGYIVVTPTDDYFLNIPEMSEDPIFERLFHQNGLSASQKFALNKLMLSGKRINIIKYSLRKDSRKWITTLNKTVSNNFTINSGCSLVELFYDDLREKEIYCQYSVEFDDNDILKNKFYWNLVDFGFIHEKAKEIFSKAFGHYVHRILVIYLRGIIVFNRNKAPICSASCLKILTDNKRLFYIIKLGNIYIEETFFSFKVIKKGKAKNTFRTAWGEKVHEVLEGRIEDIETYNIRDFEEIKEIAEKQNRFKYLGSHEEGQLKPGGEQFIKHKGKIINPKETIISSSLLTSDQEQHIYTIIKKILDNVPYSDLEDIFNIFEISEKFNVTIGDLKHGNRYDQIDVLVKLLDLCKKGKIKNKILIDILKKNEKIITGYDSQTSINSLDNNIKNKDGDDIISVKDSLKSNIPTEEEKIITTDDEQEQKEAYNREIDFNMTKLCQILTTSFDSKFKRRADFLLYINNRISNDIERFNLNIRVYKPNSAGSLTIKPDNPIYNEYCKIYKINDIDKGNRHDGFKKKMRKISDILEKEGYWRSIL